MQIDDALSSDLEAILPEKISSLLTTVVAAVAFLLAIKSIALPALNAGLVMVVGALHLISATLMSWFG